LQISIDNGNTLGRVFVTNTIWLNYIWLMLTFFGTLQLLKENNLYNVYSTMIENEIYFQWRLNEMKMALL